MTPDPASSGRNPREVDADELAMMRAQYPSRIWDIGDSGRNSWTTVKFIAGSNTDVMSTPVRAALESMCIAVDYRPVRNSVALPAALGEPASPYTILCLHGDGQGNFLGAGHMGALPAVQLAEHADFRGSTVISIACSSGKDAYVDAILSTGADAYIAPEQPPFGHAGVMFLISFFYCLTQMDDVPTALRRTGELHPTLSQWHLFH